MAEDDEADELSEDHSLCRAEVQKMIITAQNLQFTQIVGALRESLEDVLKKKDMEGFVGETRVQEMISEAVNSQLTQVVGVVRESLANVLTKKDVDVFVRASVGSQEQAKECLDALVKRVTTLEVGAAARKEGLRRRVDGIDSQVRELHCRVIEVEKVLDQELATDDENRSFGETIPAVDLQRFREGLSEGMPVHLRGLVARDDLNGKAGFLMQWRPEANRWATQIGKELVLVKVDNIVP